MRGDQPFQAPPAKENENPAIQKSANQIIGGKAGPKSAMNKHKGHHRQRKHQPCLGGERANIRNGNPV